MKGDYWLQNDTLRFNVAVNQQNQMPFQIENTYTDDYPFQNIYLRIWTKSPSGIIQDTLLLDSLSNNLGEWKTKGSGKYVCAFSHYDALKWAEVGNYSVKMIQYMRKDTLYGIKSVSVIAEKP